MTDQEVRGDYLWLSPMLTEQLSVLTEEIFGDTDPMTLPPKKRVETVIRFFSDNFTYSLQRDEYVPGRRDYYSPLLRFLFNRRTGHCELFATSAALLLRLYGVPTRYVAGVVCTRYNPAGYFYATNFDLHAWAEAWLDDEQRWILVEATPPGEEIEELLALDDSWFRGLRDRIAFQFDNMAYWFRRGYLAQVIILAWDNSYLWLLNHFREHPVGAIFELLVPVSLAVALFLYLRNRRRRRYAVAHMIRQAARMMRSLQLAVWRKTGVQREPWQTYAAWANEVDDPALNECVVLYERIRYSGRPPQPEDIEAFECAVRAVRRHPPRRKSA